MLILFAAELYRLHLSAPPQQLLRELAERAASFPADFQFDVKHPLSGQEVEELDKALHSERGTEIVQAVRPEDHSNFNQSATIAALFGWATAPVASTSSSSSSSNNASSNNLIMQCKLCARRLAVKRKNTASNAEKASETSGDTAATQQLPLPSPNKLSSVDVSSSHRRFCPYIIPSTESKSGELGYQALLARLTKLDHHNENNQISFKPSDGDRSKSNLQQVS